MTNPVRLASVFISGLLLILPALASAETPVNKITSPANGATITGNSLTVSGTCAVNGDSPYAGIHINNSVFGTTLHCVKNTFSDTVSIASLPNGSFTVQAVGNEITLFKGTGDTTQQPAASCTLDGVTIASGQSFTFYTIPSVQYPKTCSVISQSRTCTNGVLSGSSYYNKASCTMTQPPAENAVVPPPTPADTTNKITSPLNGATITGNSLTVSGTCAVNGDNAYAGVHINNSVFGTILRCVNNTFSDTISISSLPNGSFTVQAAGDSITLFKSTAEAQAASCTLNGVTIASGQSVTLYGAATVQSPAACSTIAQMRTCTNGVLSGASSYDKASCTVTRPPTEGTVVSSPAFLPFYTNLGYGSRGPEVVRLQNFLAAQGLFSGEATGNYYSVTQAAVKAFQIREGIVPASGYFGPLTRARTNAILSANATTNTNPRSGADVSPTTTTPPVPGERANTNSINPTATHDDVTRPAENSCPAIPLPACPNGHYVATGSNANACSVVYTCVANTTSTTPRINPADTHNGTPTNSNTTTPANAASSVITAAQTTESAYLAAQLQLQAKLSHCPSNLVTSTTVAGNIAISRSTLSFLSGLLASLSSGSINPQQALAQFDQFLAQGGKVHTQADVTAAQQMSNSCTQ